MHIQLYSVLLFASGGALHAQTRVYHASLYLLLALCLLWGNVIVSMKHRYYIT